MELYIYNDFIKVKNLSTDMEKLIYIGVYSPYEGVRLGVFKDEFFKALKKSDVDFENVSTTDIQFLGEQDWFIKDYVHVMEEAMENSNNRTYKFLPKKIMNVLNDIDMNNNDKKYILKNIMHNLT